MLLGILASGDVDLISNMKKNVAIWNNLFAEFYMQIEEKYKNDYAQSLVKIRNERARFETKLSKIKSIRVIHSQANFVMVELMNGISSKQLLKNLLVKYNLLIKELTTRTNGRDYLRLAVNNTKDNDILIKKLKDELGEKS